MAFNNAVFLMFLLTFTNAISEEYDNNTIGYEIENERFLKSLRDVEDTNIEDALLYRITFPCTNWCGPGNIASSDSDLGYCSDTDMCCRNHDKCDESIIVGETKYGLYNAGTFTKLNCDCDLKFRTCLKEVDSFLSKAVGNTYFEFLGDQSQKCFSYKHPSMCVKKNDCFSWRCQEYEYNVDEKELYQWFDIPTFNDCKLLM